MRKGIFIVSLFIGMIFLLCQVSVALAQESSSDEFTLEEITVTAQKRAENQQKVAIQMEVISGETLAESGQDNVDELLRNVSNAMINMAPDGMRVTVRGLADENSTWHDMHVSTPTVAVNIDGAYNSSSSAGQNLFDIERVEVLSGPQSTLYGSNSPGGIVNVVTAAPKTDRYSASGSAEIGTYSLRNYQAIFNAPVYSDMIAMRLAAQRSERGSWVDNGDNASKTTTARLKTLFQPSDKFSSTLTINWSKASSGGLRRGEVKVFDYQDGHYQDGTEVTNPWTATEGGGGGPPPMAFRGAGSLVAAQGPPPPGGGGPMGNDATTKGLSAEISWDTGIGLLSIVPSYSNQEASDLDDEREVTVAGSTVYTTQYSENHTKQKNLELRMASPQDAPFSWLVGATYYDSDRADFTDDYYYDSNDQTRNTKQTNKALYGNITYPFTATFRGTAGYRRSWDKASNLEVPAKVGNGITGQNYSNPDYKVGLEYDLAENSMLYASYATSYRVNAMAISQNTTGGDKTTPPEELKAYTIGAKNRFLGNRLQLNAAAYYYDYKNKSFQGSEDGRFGRGATVDEAVYQTDLNNDGDMIDTNNAATDLNSDGDTADPGEQAGQLAGKDISDPWIQQFGNFRSYGLDLSTDWVISGKDRLNLSVSYLNAKWTDAVVVFYWKNIWPSDGNDYSGSKNTNSPTWSVTGSYEHSFELASWGALVPHVDVQYKSSYVLDFGETNYPYNYQEPYYMINGNITYSHSSGKWSLNAYVKNATNYAVKTFWQNNAGTYSLGLNDPRTYGGVFTVRF